MSRCKPLRIVDVTDSFGMDIPLVQLLVDCGAAPSRAQAKRLIAEGAVELNGESVRANSVFVRHNSILHVGKRFWRRLAFSSKVMAEVYEMVG